ncbi:hypothetical protein ABPG74_009597 [Tetrahymena malaccensis]
MFCRNLCKLGIVATVVLSLLIVYLQIPRYQGINLSINYIIYLYFNFVICLNIFILLHPYPSICFYIYKNNLKFFMEEILIVSSTNIYLKIGTIEINRNGYNNITIKRDEYGIPSIQSETYVDVAYGLGYAHAQDRLWSIQFKRRCSQGRISEIAGEETLRSDILFRELKLDRSAQKKYQNASPHIKKILQAYADGINDYVNSLPALPLEFQIMFDDFEPYLPHHSYSLINLMSFFLTLDMVYEPFRQLLLEKYGEELALKLMGSREEFNFEMTHIMSDEDLMKTGIFENRTEHAIPKDNNVEFSKEYLKRVIQDDIVNMLDGVAKGIKGSNSWVVHGNHTASGKPLLANDPHLETMIPSIWYQSELIWKTNGKTHRAMGATLPGIPFMMIGRTEYASWGITNDIIDNSDYYIEKIQNNTYFYNNEWHPLKESPESIKVRLGQTFNFTLQETHHGPIIKGLFHLMDVKNYQSMDYPVSLSWTALIENDTCMEGLYDLHHAESVQQIEDSFYTVTSPSLNLIYATTDNHIGYYAQGRLPKKPIPGSNHFQDGTDPKNDWLGYYSKEHQPRIVDPSKGFIVTANNKIASDNLIHNVNRAQNSIPRARRITDLLKQGIKEGKKFTPQDFLRMQKDVYDVYASFVVTPVLQVFLLRGEKYLSQQKFSKYRDLLENLYKWDYKMTKESIGATIYISWEHYFFRTYLHEVSDSEDVRIILNMSYMFDHFFLFETKHMSQLVKDKTKEYKKSYCMIKETNPEGDCIKNLVLAFDQAFQHLTEKYGEDVNNWQWGLVHRHRFDHKPFSQTPLKYFFEREYIGEGNRRTINVGGVNHLPDKWDSWYSANYRQVIDMSEKNDSYFVLDTGISENIFSEHYDDQMKLHQVGKAIPMKFANQKDGKNLKTLNITFKKSNQKNNSKKDL